MSEVGDLLEDGADHVFGVEAEVEEGLVLHDGGDELIGPELHGRQWDVQRH